MDDVRDALILITTVGCGLVGGVFFAFSAFVMPALGSLPPDRGASAMRAINVFAPRAPLGLAMGLTALGAAALIVSAATGRGDGHGWLLVAGGALYLVGGMGVTVALNVPLNDALAAVDPTGSDGAEVWRSYLTDWVRWNTVRTVASLGACALFGLALR